MSSTLHLNKPKRIAVGVVVGLVLATIAMFVFLPPDIRVLLMGQTVDHCPQQDLSCPSHSPGLLFFILIPVLLAEMIWGDENAE